MIAAWTLAEAETSIWLSPTFFCPQSAIPLVLSRQVQFTSRVPATQPSKSSVQYLPCCTVHQVLYTLTVRRLVRRKLSSQRKRRR